MGAHRAMSLVWMSGRGLRGRIILIAMLVLALGISSMTVVTGYFLTDHLIRVQRLRALAALAGRPVAVAGRAVTIAWRARGTLGLRRGSPRRPRAARPHRSATRNGKPA